jgi:hypothetical protein
MTAASFRRSMRKLASFVRQVPTQTVWLTATLPPSDEAAFLQRNLLMRPRLVRESTNRPNLRYRIRLFTCRGRKGGLEELCRADVDFLRAPDAGLHAGSRVPARDHRPSNGWIRRARRMRGEGGSVRCL